MSVLLVFPPFAPSQSPYPSLPYLAGHLKAHGVEVHAVDAALAFCHWLLTPERILAGLEVARERLRALNRRDTLEGGEIRDYVDAVRLFHEGRRVLGPGSDPARWYRPGDGSPDALRLDRFHVALAAATQPHLERLSGAGPGRLAHTPHRSPWSVRDILRAAAEPGLATGFFESLLAPLLERHRPRVVGLSVAFSDQIQNAYRCARAVKALAPSTFVVLGGGFVSTCMDEVANPDLFDDVDGLVIGEGEEPLLCLVRELASASPDLLRVPGLRHRREGRVVSNPPRPIDLAGLSPPDYTALDLDAYVHGPHVRLCGIRTSRGCSWGRCAFCRTESALLRLHQPLSVDQAWRHLRHVLGHARPDMLWFTDDGVPPAVLEGLADRLLEHGAAIPWTANTRFDPHLTLDRCQRLRRSGAAYPNLGLESIHDRHLARISKGISMRLVHQVLANLAWAGVPTRVYMVVGLPGETEAEALQGFEAVQRLQADGLIVDFAYSPFELEPDSGMARHPEAHGLRGIRRPDGQDLKGGLLCDHPGIPARRAALLAHRFNSRGALPPRWVALPGEEEPLALRFDLDHGLEALLAQALPGGDACPRWRSSEVSGASEPGLRRETPGLE